MNNLENWEKTIHSKYSEQEFPFDEKNWEKAEKMLDADKKKRSGFFIYFIGLSTALLIVFGAVKFILSGNNKPAERIATVQKPNPISASTSFQSQKISDTINNQI